MSLSNLKIIGTSHIARESVRKVTGHIEEKKPDIVAVELDARRAHALLHNLKPKVSLKMVRVIGIKGFLFYSLASVIQKKLGQIVGVQPGSEMKVAITAASRQKSKIALIDRDLSVTMRRLSQEITWRERLRFVRDLFAGWLSPEFEEFRGVDLRKVPSRKVVAKVISHLEKNYPGVYKVLIQERNEHMAAALVRIIRENPEKTVLAVVGAGHEEEIAKLVEDGLDVKISYALKAGRSRTRFGHA